MSGRIAVHLVDHPGGDETDLVGGLDVSAVVAAATQAELEACVRGRRVQVGNDHRFSSRPAAADFAWLDWHRVPAFVMRSRVRKRLGPVLEACGFIVEVENVDAPPLWLFRAGPDGITSLEPEREDVDWSFDPADVGGTRIFTLAGQPDGQLHATQGFVDAVTAGRLEGMRFEEIWCARA